MIDTELQKHVAAQLHFLKGYLGLRGKFTEEKLDEAFSLQASKLMALINQSNREYCNGIIGEDEEKGDHESTRTNIELYERNNLRAELRKKNATPLEDKG